jgi:hypothetical protein
MAETMHTPGEWEVYQDEDDAIRVRETATAKGLIICELVQSSTDAEMMANADLLAAAPDLLAACEEFVRKVEAGEARSVRSYAQMTAALAKARGL